MVNDTAGKVALKSIERIMNEIDAGLESPFFPEQCAKCKDRKCRQEVLLKAANMHIRQNVWLN